MNLFPCDLLFIHRDADAGLRQNRVNEIANAIKAAEREGLRHLCVVPIRMSEAWLLFDEMAIRKAASNPNGRQPLTLPSLKQIEDTPDPKLILKQTLETASGLPSHRLSKFRSGPRRVADFVTDFSPLRHLSAFRALEDDLIKVLQEGAWL